MKANINNCQCCYHCNIYNNQNSNEVCTCSCSKCSYREPKKNKPLEQYHYRPFIQEFQDITKLGPLWNVRNLRSTDKDKHIPLDYIFSGIYHAATEQLPPDDLRVNKTMPPLNEEAQRTYTEYVLASGGSYLGSHLFLTILLFVILYVMIRHPDYIYYYAGFLKF
jgi:hypothetical protein